jgi:threonine/homoserine/homoserine lactone efflux protein
LLELAAIFGGSFTLALSGILTPGPILTVTVAESARRGFKAGPLIISGHALLELIVVLAIILGLGSYLKSALVMGIIALLGGAMLIWLGVGMVRTAGTLSLGAECAGGNLKHTPHPLAMGVIASISNPYWILWWATIGLGYLVAAMKLGVGGVIIFFLGHITADFAWYSIVSLGVSRGKALIKDKPYQMIIRLCGLLLLGFGIWFLLAAKGYLARVTL